MKSSGETNNVQFANLALPKDIHEKVFKRFADLADTSGFILGNVVEEFEQAFANYCEVDECVGVATGCDALLWILEGLGIGKGDEVITVANTFIGSVLPILRVGATPVLVDCHPENLQIDSSQVAAAITARTKAILAVHLYGHLAPMDELQDIADQNGLYLLEDAAQAHGARYRGKRAGSLGSAAGFSFYPAKNLGAWGDGGSVVTKDYDLAERIRRIRNYGQAEKYQHVELGWNSRLDSMQAIVLQEKLKLLDDWNQKRREVADRYRKGLSGLPLDLIKEDPANEAVHHLFVIMTDRRNELQASLAKKDIPTGVHYPVPIHKHKAFANEAFAQGQCFPASEKASERLLSLPMHPQLTDSEISRILEDVKAFFSSC
jgi:dTDP-4-amino-4,6-dideoxygalactose transaminase